MKHYIVNGYCRISKRTARKLFDGGLPVVLCPVNLRPQWNTIATISNTIDDPDFDKHVNAFEYYNCICNETGRYTAFYLMEG